jgi:OPA family glycerol-3-phosphate transporter-like MFS transporter
MGWRGLFFSAAGGLSLILLLNHRLLKEDSTAIGAPEPEAHPANLFREHDADAPAGAMDLLRPFLRSPAFWAVAGMSLQLTFIRETFYLWMPAYLTETAGLPPGAAAQYSLLYPLFGGFSVLLTGFLSDRVGAGKRGRLLMLSLLPLTLILLAMSRIPPDGPVALPLAMISGVALVMFGPYSFLEGVMALDLGGRRGSSTAAGLIGGMGYLGAMLSGYGVGVLVQRGGWGAAFAALAGVSGLSLLTAWGFGRAERGRDGPD